jgi:hypothetical protein
MLKQVSWAVVVPWVIVVILTAIIASSPVGVTRSAAAGDKPQPVDYAVQTRSELEVPLLKTGLKDMGLRGWKLVAIDSKDQFIFVKELKE